MGISLSFAALEPARRGLGERDAEGPDVRGEGRVAEAEARLRRAVVARRDVRGVERRLAGRPRGPEVREDDLGRTREIQRRFNVSVPRARVTEKTSTLRDRSER